jgi:hypothetical protein
VGDIQRGRRAMSAIATEADYMPGDPAQHIIGKPEEKSARRHRPLPPKERPNTAKTILADIKMRRQELEPLVEEHKLLTRAVEALKGI